MVGCKIDFKHHSSADSLHGIVVAQIIETDNLSKPQTKFLVQLMGAVKVIDNSKVIKILPSAITYVNQADIQYVLRNGSSVL
ncbi:hypothetical protein MA9V1_065 [Chryseobacterium phage MA9V-1]|nr:hypothetical protein MA9V1_065 [Chryseobacterium phage MA9V-1]